MIAASWKCLESSMLLSVGRNLNLDVAGLKAVFTPRRFAMRRSDGGPMHTARRFPQTGSLELRRCRK